MNIRSVSALLALLALAAIAQAGDDPAAHGASLLAPFKAELKSALMAGMKEGPATAIEVCSKDAPGIAAKLSVDGVLMGRSSHKLRNPDNTAPDWLSPIMQAYLDEPSNRNPRAVSLPGNRWGYVEPIMVQPLCLTCHGSELSPDVASRISELYPDDHATGFAAGDLRGVFWVEFPETAP